MSERLFGTDGVRGIPGRYPLTPSVVAEIAEIAARLLLARRAAGRDGGAPLALIGRDTRGSGPSLTKSLVRGLSAAGCRVVDLGVAPTPAVSYLTPRLGALCGIVVSASHNPAQFNGIKFFTSDGLKMDPSCENDIEKELGSVESAAKSARRPDSPVEDGHGYVGRYVEFLRSTFPASLDLSGLRLVVDCAHGAAAALAPAVFEGLGADVFALGCAPDGRNINAGFGALYPERMAAAVRRSGAHCGVSFDGDADRAIFADETGALLDGDALICMSAVHLKRLGLLRSDTVALTVMSNFGLLKFLERQGVSVVTVPVGDRNVTEAIEKEGLSLGGEASGHLIFREFAATGDGLLTALQTLAVLRASGGPMSAQRRLFRPTPQILKNIAVARKVPLRELPRVEALIARCERKLKGEGRVFVRYSGTEPLLRVMIEGPSLAAIRSMAREITAAYVQETGQVQEPIGENE